MNRSNLSVVIGLILAVTTIKSFVGNDVKNVKTLCEVPSGKVENVGGTITSIAPGLSNRDTLINIANTDNTCSVTANINESMAFTTLKVGYYVLLKGEMSGGFMTVESYEINPIDRAEVVNSNQVETTIINMNRDSLDRAPNNQGGVLGLNTGGYLFINSRLMREIDNEYREYRVKYIESGNMFEAISVERM